MKNTTNTNDLRDIDAQIEALANSTHSAAACSELHRLSVVRAELMSQSRITEHDTYTRASNANCVAIRQVESVGNRFRSRYIERDARGKVTTSGEWGEWSTRGSRSM